MDLFDLRNHLMNHYQKLNSVTSVIKNGREPALGSRSGRKSSSSRALNVRRHDCLTPLEKLPTYRPELLTNQMRIKDDFDVGSDVFIRNKVMKPKDIEQNVDHDYAHFAWLITEDILHNKVFKVEDIKRVFQSHIEANRGRLNMAKMLSQIEILKETLSIEDHIVQSPNLKEQIFPENPVQIAEVPNIQFPKTKSFCDVAVNTIIECDDFDNRQKSCVDNKSIGVMADIRLPEVQKHDKEVNTSKPHTSQLSLSSEAPKTKGVEISEKLPASPERETREGPILTAVNGLEKYSKSDQRPFDFKKKINLIYSHNWSMMKRYELVTNQRNQSTKTKNDVELDDYETRKNLNSILDDCDNYAISDDDILFTSVSTGSESNEDFDEISSIDLSAC